MTLCQAYEALSKGQLVTAEWASMDFTGTLLEVSAGASGDMAVVLDERGFDQMVPMSALVLAD